MLALANAGSCVGPQNKIGQRARRQSQSIDAVAVLSSRKIQIGSKTCVTVYHNSEWRSCGLINCLTSRKSLQ